MAQVDQMPRCAVRSIDVIHDDGRSPVSWRYPIEKNDWSPGTKLSVGDRVQIRGGQQDAIHTAREKSFQMPLFLLYIVVRIAQQDRISHIPRGILDSSEDVNKKTA